MSLLQKIGCCSCTIPALPCNECSNERCTCGPSEAQPKVIPVTSVHIEVSEMSTSRFSAGVKDQEAWHYRTNKSWRSTEYGVRFDQLIGTISRLALTAQAYAGGFRYGDHMPVAQITSRLAPLSIPAGRWGNYPEQGLNSFKAQCGPCPQTGKCGDSLVICCRCSEPGQSHDCFATTDWACLQSQGQIQGPYDGGPLSGACFACTDSCNGWSSGLVGAVQRSYNLINDAFFRGGGNLFRTVFSLKVTETKDPVKRREISKRRRLVQSSVETSNDPQIFTEEQTTTIANSEGKLERTESRVRIPITTTVDHEGEVLELVGGFGRGIGGGGGGGPGGGGPGEPVDCSQDPGVTCSTGIGCPPGCTCIGGNCVEVPPNDGCSIHCGRFNSCTKQGRYYDRFFNAYDQSKSGVYNYINGRNDCCSASYAGTSITVEMDWPCEETADAYIRAKQKVDFGEAAFKEAQRYCTENPGTPECGNNSAKPECCNPLAQELIGALPPTTLPCIKHCPLQPTCDDEYVRWPQGDKQPFGENVEQSISCMGGVTVEETFDPNEDYTPSIEGPDDVSADILTPTGSSPCSFKTNPVSRNYASYCNGGHQCGNSYCGPQFCCHEIDCYQTGCCEQILDYNPNTGEPVTDEQRLYLGPFNELCPYGLAADEDGNIGGWAAIPDTNGVYRRCKRPLADCSFSSPSGDDVVIEGCEYQPKGDRSCNPNCPSGDFAPPCCSDGDFCSPSGDVISWIIPRKLPGAPQGIYSSHCPDTIEPFTPNGPSKYVNPNCRREIAPAVGDLGWCEYGAYNPSGTVCNGGFCTYMNTPQGENGDGPWGDPYHEWPNQDFPDGNIGQCGVSYGFPCMKKPTGFSGTCTPNSWESNADVNHSPAACGATPCDDVVLPNGRVCVRCAYKGIGKRVVSGSTGACNQRPCDGVPGVIPTLGKWVDGYYEHELGLQKVSVTCAPLPTKNFENGPIYTAGKCDENEQRPELGFEKGFQISLEYTGGGCSYNQIDQTVGRQGQGSFTLIKDYTAPDDCIFGSYSNLLKGNWSTGGGDGPAPYYDRNNPGQGFYYKHGLNLDEANQPECDKDIWKRAGASASCKWSNPRAVIL